MNTKLKLIAGLATGLALQFGSSVMANSILLTAGATPNVLIPDNNLNGVASSVSVSGSTISHITSVSVTVDVTGDPNAWNGDYYAYLQFTPLVGPPDPAVVLLNRLGTTSLPPVYPPYGSPGNGFDVTFSQSAAINISSAPGLNSLATLTGTYQPQSGAGPNLDAMDGQSPDGTWTVFIADESAGDVGKLTSWSMQVIGTPDNGGTMLLLGMSAGFMGLFSIRQPRPAPICRK